MKTRIISSAALRCALSLAAVSFLILAPAWAQQGPPARAAGEAGGPTPAPFPSGKYGGVLHAVTRENPPSLSPHEEVTISVAWLVQPLYSNLVLYDPFRQLEDSAHLIGELAESWAWSDAGKRLTFKLRRGVRWHDGKPFSAADVKHTLNLARGVSELRLKLNPRKVWWVNVRDVVTSGDYEVSVVLSRPQPALLAFLASSWAAIYPAHVDPQVLRTRAVGTGPFRLKEYTPDERLVLEKNPDYFVKGRPYLDGITYAMIRVRAARMAALMAGQVDVTFPNDGSAGVREDVLAAVPSMVVYEVATGVSENVLVNRTKPPFDNPKIALAVSLALDRPSLVQSVHRGAGILGGANTPAPYGQWGLAADELARLPGYGDGAGNKAQARKLLAEAGYGPGNPLRVTMGTRAVENYVDMAVWVMDQLRQVGIEATLEQTESATWIPKLMRRDYQIGSNLTGVAVDDPDASFYEGYVCGSPRNYTGYCNPAVDELIERQSRELDRAKRLDLVREIDRHLQLESARPMLMHRVDHFMHWPYVKNLLPHHNIYNYGRMQEVWLDK